MPIDRATPADLRRTIETVWRMESARVIAAAARIVRDVGRAEELANDAFVAALEQWSASEIPQNPAAWLVATARRRAIDFVRRERRFDDKSDDVARQFAASRKAAMSDPDIAIDDDIGDDLLRLIFTVCHPVLATEARVALTLRLLGGLTTDEIARGCLVPEPTIAQRIVRAKRRLTDENVEFEVPRGSELQRRLSSVLEVVYLIFNEGYTATAGTEWMRPTLCEEALRLARVLTGLAPQEPEVHGLAALLEIQASRLRARVDRTGEPILLLNQNRAAWDQLLIRRGLAALAEADRLGGADGFYALQAAIAACHARAVVAADTDWHRIVALYGRLAELTHSPIVELNRAVAVSMADGPAAALPLVEGLADEPALKTYHLLPSVRGDLLAKLGRFGEASVACELAASLTSNERERDLLRRRAESFGRQAGEQG